MEESEEKSFEIVITSSAKVRFFEIVEYLFDHYPFERAESLSDEIMSCVKSLSNSPQRGSVESRLKDRKYRYRYILFRRSNRTDIKIIYFIDTSKDIVYITDFFPTEMDDQKISNRI